MKKVIIILLTVIMSLTLFACVDNNKDSNDRIIGKDCSIITQCDTFIQDCNGEDKCFWEDGGLAFDDFTGTGRQEIKRATLSLQEEYDMWFRIEIYDLDFVNFFDLFEVECDATKIEIKKNPNKNNHFIIKALQPCNQERVVFIISNKSVDKNGEPRYGAVPNAGRLPIMISAE